MARINYTAVLKGIRDALDNDASIRLVDATVEIASPTVVGAKPHINIFENRRDATAGQALAGGTLQRYMVRWIIVVSTFSAESFEDAAAQRDELLGYVEIALLRSRNLGGALANPALLLMGGSLRSGPGDSGGWWAEGDVEVAAEIQFSST